MSKQKSKPGTVKMKFSTDQYYGVAINGDVTESMKDPLYLKDKVYDIEERMVARWMKRGGVLVADEATDTRALDAAKVEDKKTDDKGDGKEQVETATKKEEDGGKSVNSAAKK